VFVDLITAVAVGMIMTSFIFMQRMVDLQMDSVTAITNPSEEDPLSEEEAELLQAAGGRILLYHISGPMSFGAAKGMARRLAGFEDYDVLILDLSDVPHIDFTSCRALEDILHSAWDINSETFLVDCKKPVYRTLRKQGIVKRFEKYQLKAKRIDALKDGLQIVKDRQNS
jgi:SulP family sulfate permease